MGRSRQELTSTPSSQSMADHTDAVEANVEQGNPAELTQRRIHRERSEDVPRTDDAAARTSSAPIEGGTGQRCRGLETSCEVIRRSQRKSTASHAAVHHASEAVPSIPGKL